jgi:hypothetical protein
MNGLGLIVMGPWPQFTVALALTSALTSATAGTSRSKASWTDRAEEGEGMAARPAPAASTRAHRTLDARGLIGSAPDILVEIGDLDRGYRAIDIIRQDARLYSLTCPLYLAVVVVLLVPRTRRASLSRCA